MTPSAQHNGFADCVKTGKDGTVYTVRKRVFHGEHKLSFAPEPEEQQKSNGKVKLFIAIMLVCQIQMLAAPAIDLLKRPTEPIQKHERIEDLIHLVDALITNILYEEGIRR